MNRAGRRPHLCSIKLLFTHRKKCCNMKKIIVILVLFGLAKQWAAAQESAEKVSFTTGELRVGYGATRFGAGLKEAYEAGGFGPTGGGLYSLALFHKFTRIPYVQFGLKFKALGAGPSTGDNGNELFFNYWNNGIAVKYYPLDRATRRGLVVYADYFFVGQFTQKYRNTARQEFNHQFAIGSAFNGGIGYEFPLKRRNTAITIGLEYESASRQGEVSGVGDRQFRNTNIGFMAGLRF